MQWYKYSYQDWVNDDFNTYNVALVGRHFEPEDLTRVFKEQDEAYTKGLNTVFEALKHDFKAEYATTFLKKDFLEACIQNFKELTDNAVSKTNALYASFDGRRALKKTDVDLLLNAKVGDKSINVLTNEVRHGYSDYSVLSIPEFERGPFFYIIKSNFYNWLLWFQQQEYLDNSEPTLNKSVNHRDLSKSVKKTIGKQLSYTWLSNPDVELLDLYQLLIENALIHPDTTIEQFKAVFTSEPLQTIEPVKWHDENASELLYFILQLESTESIKAGKQTNYKRLKSCFVKPDGTEFKEVFKSLKTRINTDLSEQKQQTIRSIVNSFL